MLSPFDRSLCSRCHPQHVQERGQRECVESCVGSNCTHVISIGVLPVFASVHGRDPRWRDLVLCDDRERRRVQRRPLYPKVALREPLRRFYHTVLQTREHRVRLQMRVLQAEAVGRTGYRVSAARNKRLILFYSTGLPVAHWLPWGSRPRERLSECRIVRDAIEIKYKEKTTHSTPCWKSCKRPGAVRSSWPRVDTYPSLRNSRPAGKRAFWIAADAFPSFATRSVMKTSSEARG